MSGYLGPRNKKARRFGVNLWGRNENPVALSGKRRRINKKKSDYGIRLDEKQKLKYFYGGIREKQFKSYYLKSRKKGGNIGNTFLQLLELRLDVIVYRLNFTPTIFSSRQLVSHRHVLVNGKVVDIPSYLVKPGSEIGLKEKSKNLALVSEHLAAPERTIPVYLTFSKDDLTGKLERIPERQDISYPFILNESFIVEFYSK